MNSNMIILEIEVQCILSTHFLAMFCNVQLVQFANVQLVQFANVQLV